MRITTFAIGTRMPAWVNDGVENYRKRLPRHIDFSFREITAAQRGGAAAAATQMAKEGERMLKALPDGAHVIALDERGRSWTSTELAQQLEKWLANYPDVALLVGGADGLAPECKERAAQVWSLSPLTLPHPLVRIVLTEQIYRAWTLIQGHPYHRD